MLLINGLSPLARGTRLRISPYRCALRFIPAGAGNTRPAPERCPWHSVYPRWRGEHAIVDGTRDLPVGLSPLARGTRTLSARRKSSSRFIPAGAGNTPEFRPANSRTAVYPRWRGEHVEQLSGVAANIGLSPLARGTRSEKHGCTDSDRFIPAGAGNTRPAPERCPWHSVYPRWRGEHGLYQRGGKARPGLSPLTRGTQTGARS